LRRESFYIKFTDSQVLKSLNFKYVELLILDSKEYGNAWKILACAKIIDFIKRNVYKIISKII